MPGEIVPYDPANVVPARPVPEETFEQIVDAAAERLKKKGETWAKNKFKGLLKAIGLRE